MGVMLAEFGASISYRPGKRQVRARRSYLSALYIELPSCSRQQYFPYIQNSRRVLVITVNMLPSFLLISRAIAAIVSVVISVVVLTFQYAKCYISDVVTVCVVLRDVIAMETYLR